MGDSSLEPCDVLPCPVCGVKMNISKTRARLRICVCLNCGTSVSVPEEAWNKASPLFERYAVTRRVLKDE